MNQNDEFMQLRVDQARQGRRMAAEEGRTFKVPVVVSRKPKEKLTGHEGYLKGLQESGAQLQVITMAGEVQEGKLKHADKYTISLEIVSSDDQKHTLVLFKHAIESFRSLTPPPFLLKREEQENAGLTD